MGKLRRKLRRMSLYKKSLIVFALILLVLMEVALIYVVKSLKAYENGDVNNYLNALINDMQKAAKTGNLEKYITFDDMNSDYEKTSSLEKGYADLFKNGKLESVEVEEGKIYDITSDGKVIARITLDDSKEEHRLGLLTYVAYEVEAIKTFHEKGLYELDFYLADNYKLYINGKEVKENDLVESSLIEEYKEVYDLVDLPKLNHYHIANLTYKPKIEVKDSDGKKIEYEVKDGAYYATDFYNTDDSSLAMEKLIEEYDPLVFAKNWSLFLTADLQGPKWGLYTLTPNLIEGTELYKLAYNWGTQVDITFTSNHTLDKETFTGTKVSNFTVYNENAFSAEVYLEKHMTLVDGQKKTDVLHDIMYFVYYDNAWRLVLMNPVTE